VEQHGEFWRVHGLLQQEEPLYELDLSLALTSEGSRATHKVTFSADRQPLDLTSKGRPQSLVVDPEFDNFRRLHPSEIPPSVNHMKGSNTVLLVVSGAPRKGLMEAARILTLSLGLENTRIVSEDRLDEPSHESHDLLFLGLPTTRTLPFQEPSGLTLKEEGFTVEGRTFDTPADVFFGVFADPRNTGRVTALFLPLSMDHAKEAARKITHYGKYSYLVFRAGRNQIKGIWPVLESPLVCRW
jgi:hypothetical protein